MRNDHFTLIIVPEGTSGMRQIRCSWMVFRILLIVGVSLLVALPIGIWSWLTTYQQQQVLASKLPQLREETRVQNMAIEHYEQNLQEVRQTVGQLERAQAKLLGLAGIAEPLKTISSYGLGGETDPDALTANPVQVSQETEATVLAKIAQVDALKTSLFEQQQGVQRLEEFLQDQQVLLAAMPSIMPVIGDFEFSSKFGWRKDPFTGKKTMHYGIDITAAKGTPIVASADGVVSYADEKGSFGKVVVIDHGYGYSTFYGHCSALETTIGAHVKRGDLIARVGNTGRSESSHLHYEVRVDNVAQDPRPFILDR